MELLVEVLRQALVGPAEQRLYRSGKLEGLFPSRSGANGLTAQAALRQGLLELVRTETKGKTAIDWVRITPRGVEYLHEHESPVCALRDLQTALRAGRNALPAWLNEMRAGLHALEARLEADAARWDRQLEALETRVGESLRRVEAAGPLLPPEVIRDYPWAIDALNYLDRRRLGGATGECSLPELFAAVRLHHAELSIPVFHDGLRKMHERRALRLRPPGTPEEVSQPEYALWHEGAVLYQVER
jgi:hypothetical protein